MIGLLFELFEWMIKLTIIACVLFAKAVAWTYRAIEQLVHQHRLGKNPAADRGTSQFIAGSTVAAMLGVLVLIGSVTGGSNATGGGNGGDGTAQAAPLTGQLSHHRTRTNARLRRGRQDAKRARAARARRARLAAARRAEAAREHRTRLAAARRAKAAREHRTRLAAARQAAAAASCNPNYSGCLKADSPDYDCSGGSGDGPDYTGQVNVVGEDVYDLDRDGDGIACD